MNDEREEPRKLWNGTKRKANLLVSIHGRKSVIHIGKDVIRVIGAPSYVSLKVNQDMHSFIVVPSAEKEPMSFKVPDNIMFDNNKMLRVSSQPFVISLLAMNDLDAYHTYRVMGIYSEKNNAVIFNMADIQIYGDDNKDNIAHSG